MSYLTRWQHGARIAFSMFSRVVLSKATGQGYGSCLLVFVDTPQECGVFLRSTAIGSIPVDSLRQILYQPRKCLTDFHVGFMMVSSLRKEVVQSNMGICSDCRFIITREVADS
jgi:hypothetical protein